MTIKIKYNKHKKCKSVELDTKIKGKCKIIFKKLRRKNVK